MGESDQVTQNDGAYVENLFFFYVFFLAKGIPLLPAYFLYFDHNVVRSVDLDSASKRHTRHTYIFATTQTHTHPRNHCTQTILSRV